MPPELEAQSSLLNGQRHPSYFIFLCRGWPSAVRVQGRILGTDGRALVGLSDSQGPGEKAKVSEGAVLGCFEEGMGGCRRNRFERRQVWSFPCIGLLCSSCMFGC